MVTVAAFFVLIMNTIKNEDFFRKWLLVQVGLRRRQGNFVVLYLLLSNSKVAQIFSVL